MTSAYDEIFRRTCQPLEPLPTGQRPVLRRLPDVRAVLFDVYGTLFVSGSGEVGVAQPTEEPDALRAALAACGFRGSVDAQAGVECLVSTIQSHHAVQRSRGVDYPEVDIVQVWRDWLGRMADHGWMDPCGQPLDPRQLAVEYEVRANPTWPMPGLVRCLQSLRRAGLRLGIVSNAQFYTRHMFVGLLGAAPEAMGFDPDLQFYSFEYLRAKPDTFLFELATKALAKHGVRAEKVIYVGNDMLNDVQAARRVGFRTALFAGDRRSLRWRTGDDRVQDVMPDVVLTQLDALAACLAASPTPPPG